MRMTHDLRGHHRTRSVRVEVRSVQLGGEATGRITVTCDGQTRQFDTGRLAGVFVQAGGGDGTVRVDIQGEDEAP